MEIKIALLSGDGIGPEVTKQAVKALKAIEEIYNHTFYFTEAPVGALAIDKTGNPLPEATLKLCKDSHAVLFGAIGDPKYDHDPTAKVRPEQGLLKLRKELGLFANIRPIKTYDTLLDKSPLKKEIIQGTDMIIYRELTGGIYFGEKKLNETGTIASDLCKYTKEEIERITHLAFKAAYTRKKHVTLVDKANVLESSRLWRKVVTEIAKDYPDITLDFLFVDNAAMQIILNPSSFDVILTENMFGDIISDEGSVIGGSIGLLASASIGNKNALFEPIHGSYPQAKGKGIANPIASILSAAMLLEHFGLYEESIAINKAVDKALQSKIVTVDLNKDLNYSTEVVGDTIAEFILNKDVEIVNFENLKIGKSVLI
ncbi:MULTISPECIES: 3-isopropylmalate dehydrogenase [Flavobacterium]|uniref:3-isopropylmalate dehydrogenase n=1 Tax=Flavobacterium columnare TaxID=996 RepID=A0AA94F2C3_9FLAO|nr:MULTISPECIES: 3-isopropylmalate dehydrogenase [Flavobacterium]MCH4828402.1 3-isopropylmalate dehydrogenase [Flavobacterium columnare]MCH4832230.1 3-isopropylmalate dehydrogenase [Flavobacterium columnare]OWP86935.1 3-isopropylmalate dehydrogenase [Flavobacterium covae]